MARLVRRGVGVRAKLGERLVVCARSGGELGFELAFGIGPSRAPGRFLGAGAFAGGLFARLRERLVELLFALLLGGRDRGLELRFGAPFALFEIRAKRCFARVALRDVGLVRSFSLGELGGGGVEVLLDLLALALEVFGALARLLLVVLRRLFALVASATLRSSSPMRSPRSALSRSRTS